MKKYGLLVTVKVKSGKESDVENFLRSAEELAKKEEKTITWYSFQIDQNTFGIFDTFEDEDGRSAHLDGEIARQLMENASKLLSEDPKIRKIDIISSK